MQSGVAAALLVFLEAVVPSFGSLVRSFIFETVSNGWNIRRCPNVRQMGGFRAIKRTVSSVAIFRELCRLADPHVSPLVLARPRHVSGLILDCVSRSRSGSLLVRTL